MLPVVADGKSRHSIIEIRSLDYYIPCQMQVPVLRAAAGSSCAFLLNVHCPVQKGCGDEVRVLRV